MENDIRMNHPHTPGPWTAKPSQREQSEAAWQVFGSEGRLVCDLEPLLFREDVLAAESDASLIASAPDLLAKLEASDIMLSALRHILVGAPGWNSEAEAHLLAQQATNRAAIAKAKGGAT